MLIIARQNRPRQPIAFTPMSSHVILDEPYASVYADAAMPCIIVRLHSFANREQFKQLMNAGLAYYQAHHTPQTPWVWIADTRQMSAIQNEVQQ